MTFWRNSARQPPRTNQYNIIMAKSKKITFHNIIMELRNKHELDDKYDLDYFIGDDLEPNPYDDYYSVTSFGANEGIYTDFYVLRESDSKREHIATAKTLFESDEAYMKMCELGGKVSLMLRKMSVV